MDVTVSAMGDAKACKAELFGNAAARADGTFMPLRGDHGNQWFPGRRRPPDHAGVPTVGRIANGALIEREIEFA